MLYKVRRRLYSQNFLRDPKLVEKLIRNSSIGKSDTVLEIGPGKGIITRELVKTSGKVIAVELDRKLFLHLNKKFRNIKNLKLVQGDFLRFNLPQSSYKVFANIPFNITSQVIRKLSSDNNFSEAYLIVQKEAAKRFIGKPLDDKNSMVSVLLKPWFEIEVYRQFKNSDFIPNPHVDIFMIRIIKRKNPLVEIANKNLYRDYIICNYSKLKIADLDIKKVFRLFKRFFNRASPDERRKVSMKAQEFLTHQKNFHRKNAFTLEKSNLWL
ncbi:MAG: rRNA (Adenine-N(6)-)-methyltransferase [Microgenomates group bacterium GW2011_GWC1_37_8]|uniref:rRNA (Adenine-N(6)-)-methyltransferase n=1 Tax=Candidatus Woesebacteria bacterium GW2011_GWB1_38_8 TaxID=1618570 RepID=A0A0G0L155_9BACT|nr:MAG: rRNA (Adenine-N(6)-)-methyltransferase [Microgenomates group bacterium GW2011_GWC1_37_8]KKQ84727.1 MAG: rRNA (Adenine-N(6)-)-methyltransferase [Candidatus Woesebacteria bacterium GW2011_GWB1_38_8]